MPVKTSKSGTRVLSVLEQIARNQPIGVSDLARIMAADKSAVQRAIVTLAEDGWLHAAPGRARQWQLTGHIHLVAHLARSSNSLRQRALPVMAALRDATGETVFLTVPDIGRFVVIEVIESRHLLRSAPHIGMAVTPGDSATGKVVLPYLSAEEQANLLCTPADDELLANFAATRTRGFAVSEDAQAGGSVNIAAPIFEQDGRPAAAIVLSAPRERLRDGDHQRLGAMVADAAQALSPPPRVTAN